MGSEYDYNKITAIISAAEQFEHLVPQVCKTHSVVSLIQFNEMYELEERSLNKKYDNKPKVAPSNELFAETFKMLEEFPPNLQKSKKVPPMRERLNSTSKSSPILNDSVGLNSNNQNKTNSPSLSNLNKLDDVPTLKQISDDFAKFQKQLKELKAEILDHDIEKEYVNKLEQLRMFAQQLEKLLPTEKVGKSALSPEEETILENLVKRMEDLNFIRTHHSVSCKQSGSTNNISAKLESLVDILSHCLLAVNSPSLI